MIISGSLTIIVLSLPLISSILIVKYLNGDFTIKSNEIIKENTYDVTLSNMIHGEYGNGKLTRVVHKITYESGKVKYKTKEYKH